MLSCYVYILCLSIKGNGNYWFFEIMIKYSNKVFPQLLQSLHHANCLNIVFLVRSIIYGNTIDNKDTDFKGISSNGDIFFCSVSFEYFVLRNYSKAL